jgi:purine-cytosine permease-like protein
MNLYSGSVALASGFDVAAHFRPGRPWWMFLVWFFGVVFYAVNVIDSLGTFLAITGVLTNTWVLIVLADYFICRVCASPAASRSSFARTRYEPETPVAWPRLASLYSWARSASAGPTRSTTPRSPQ